MADSHLAAVSVLLPDAVPVSPAGGEVASAPEWRAVCQAPGRTPIDMAVETGRPTVQHCQIEPELFDWLIHTGSGFQGTSLWPAHHAIQSALLGSHGNALEVRQFCAGGLSSWLLADRLRHTDRAVVCTAADNWSWTDRFATSRADGGEPAADVASAAVLGRAGFARVIGTGNASCPEHEQAWRSDDRHWTGQPHEEFAKAYAQAMAAQTRPSMSAWFKTIRHAIRAALDDAGVSPDRITHFVPPSSRTGEPFRYFAGSLGLPWNDTLYQFHLEHGYLSVSAQAAALVTLAKSGALTSDSTVLLTATEYNISATAIVLRIIRPPAVLSRNQLTTIR